MAGEAQVKETTIRPLAEVLKEVERKIYDEPFVVDPPHQSIRDLRWKFDQVSAKMNQAIYNNQREQIHESCLQTVTVLIEILARS